MLRPFILAAVLAAVPAAAATAGEPLVLAESHPDFTEPRVVASSNGVLDTTLRVAYARNQIGRDPVCLRSYNGGLTGPTLRARPGDKLRIRLQNELRNTPGGGCVGGDLPGVAYAVTNLHTHGLHVSPSGRSDNVLVEVGPGESFDYEIEIGKDHPSGTFWYHAHHHGTTAIQLASGMSGVLLVQGTGLDTVPEIAAVRQRIFLFQQIPYDAQGRVEDFAAAFGPGKWHQSGRFTTINGQVQPRIELRPGAVERWRMVHGGVRESLRVRLIDAGGRVLPPAFHEIALDGLATGDLFPKDEVELEPGYRSDVLFVAPAEPGRYYVIDEATPPGQSLLGENEPRAVLAVLDVRGQRISWPLPRREALARHRPFPRIDRLTGPAQSVEFSIEGSPPKFMVDGREFDPEMDPRSLRLGQTAEWTLKSKQANHPFHIHVNPFEVATVDSRGAPTTVWRDTLMVRASDPDGIKVRTRYAEHTGCFVLHCHILDHEDLGMMELVEIVDARGNGRCPKGAMSGHAAHAAQAGHAADGEVTP